MEKIDERDFLLKELENYYKRKEIVLNKKIDKCSRTAGGIISNYLKRTKKRFKILTISGISIMIISIALTVYQLTFSHFNIILDSTVWNQLFYLGLSLFSFGFIFLQIHDSLQNQARFKTSEEMRRCVESMRMEIERGKEVIRSFKNLEEIDAGTSKLTMSDMKNDQFYEKMLIDKLLNIVENKK